MTTTNDNCPRCDRDVSGMKGMYVRLDGVVYKECGMGEGHNAEEPATWLGYLGGALVYDIPFLIFGLLFILSIEYLLGGEFDRVLIQNAWIARSVVYGVFSFVPTLALWWCGLPVMITPVVLSIVSYIIII